MKIIDYNNILESELFDSSINNNANNNQTPGLNAPMLDANTSVFNIPTTGTDIVGWVNGVTFASTVYNIVTWSAGDIILGDGTTYTVTSGNTGAMSAVTYIYLTLSTSVIATTTSAVNSVGSDKILLCVANLTITGKQAEFQAFGTSSQSVFITADNIAANTITGNEIVANTITSTQINTSGINIGEWSGDLDNVDDGSIYNKTTVNEVTGAGRGFNALNSNNRYSEWLSAGEMITGTNPTNGVVFDSAGIRGYGAGVNTFDLKASDGSALFRGTIYASGGEITGDLDVSGSISTATAGTGVFLQNDGLDFYYSSSLAGKIYSNFNEIVIGGTGKSVAIVGSLLATGVINLGASALTLQVDPITNDLNFNGRFIPEYTGAYTASSGKFVANSSGGSPTYQMGALTMSVGGTNRGFFVL